MNYDLAPSLAPSGNPTAIKFPPTFGYGTPLNTDDYMVRLEMVYLGRSNRQTTITYGHLGLHNRKYETYEELWEQNRHGSVRWLVQYRVETDMFFESYMPYLDNADEVKEFSKDAYKDLPNTPRGYSTWLKKTRETVAPESFLSYVCRCELENSRCTLHHTHAEFMHKNCILR